MEVMEKIISEVLSYCPWGEVGETTAHDVAKALIEEGYGKLEEPEKTADEMFAELGYERDYDIDGDVIYIHESRIKMIAIKDRTCCARWNMPGGWVDTRISFEEILACARLIAEMEADNG